MVIPNLQKVTIKEIHDDCSKPLSLAKPGEVVEVNLTPDVLKNSSHTRLR